MDVDPHLLRTFVTVVRCGSFSRAARELGYTQSAVSQHIAVLEGHLGTVLLHRRPVTPTDAGGRLLEHAEPLLLRWDAARADLARFTSDTAGRIVVAASPLAMTERLADALAGLRRSHPGLPTTVRVQGREAVVRDVSSGAADLGLIDGMTAPHDPLQLLDVGPLTALTVDEQPLAVVLPMRHPLTNRAGLRLADLADAWWIDAPDTAPTLAQLRVTSGFDGFRAAVRYDGTDLRGLVVLVAAGHGLALLPRRAVDAVSGVVAIPVCAPRLAHRTEALYRDVTDSPAALLAAALVAEAAQASA